MRRPFLGFIVMSAVSLLHASPEEVPPLTSFTYPQSFDDHGRISGWCNAGYPNLRACVWIDGALIDLGYPVQTSIHPYFGGTHINKRGQVVGTSSSPLDPITHMLFWDRGTLTDLGNLGGTLHRAFAINDHGQVVGVSELASGAPHTVFWDGVELIDLGILDSSPALNNHGQVLVKEQLNGPPYYRSHLWDRGSMTELDFLGVALNDRGEVVGERIGPTGEATNIVVWKDGVATDLPKLDASELYSFVADINNAGQVLAISVTKADVYFLIESQVYVIDNGRPIAIGKLGPGASLAFKINEKGQVAGHDFFTGRHAFFWDNGVVTPISPDSNVVLVTDINDRGQVLAFRDDGGHFFWENGVITEIEVSQVSPSAGQPQAEDLLRLQELLHWNSAFAAGRPLLGSKTSLSPAGR